MSDVPFGHYIRMIVAASRFGARLVPLRDIRLLGDDEEQLHRRLVAVREAGLQALSVEETARWSALLLYAFGRQAPSGSLDGALFGNLTAQELSLLPFGRELWVRLGVAAADRELVGLLTICAVPVPSPSRPPQTPRPSIAVGARTSIDRLLQAIIGISPSWRPGKSLRRLVVTAADEMEFERALSTWLWRETSDSPLTMGAVFILYGSRIFARESRYDYRTLEKRLGVSALEESVAIRYRAIQKGTSAYFGINLSGGPNQYIDQMLLHSGGGWEHVAEVLEKLQGGLALDRTLSWSDISDALMLLPKRTEVSDALRTMLREPPTREFINNAIELLSAACRRLDPAERTPEALGEELDIASEDARRRIAAVVGARRPTTVAPRVAKLELHLRNASGEMPRVVVALPHTLEWPDFLPEDAERFRLFVAGESRTRPVAYQREGVLGRRQGPVEHLELPASASLPIEVVLETERGSQVVFERLTLSDAVTVFSLETGKVQARIPQSGEVGLVIAPGCQLVGEWGRELAARSGLTVRVGELPPTPVELLVRRIDGSDESFALDAARAVPVLALDGFLDGVAFGRVGRVAVKNPQVHAVRCSSLSARVVVDGRGRREEIDVDEGQRVPLPGLAAPGLYNVILHPRGRSRPFVYAPRATFSSSRYGARVVLEAMWSPDEPAQIRVDERVATGVLSLEVRNAGTVSVGLAPPTFASEIGEVRWTVAVHPRRLEVVSEPRGAALENPIFERLRFGGGLRIYGSPREQVTIEPGYYRRRTVCLDASGQAFLPFAHLDESELEHDLGHGQLRIEATWSGPHHREECRIAREDSLRADVRVIANGDAAWALEVDAPAGIAEPVIETLPLWKPWEGWSRMPVRELAAAASGLVVEAPLVPGPYLCGVSDGTDMERQLRAPPRSVFVGSADTEEPPGLLESLLWRHDKEPAEMSIIVDAFDKRFATDADEMLDGLLRLFERSGTGSFTIGTAFVHAVGAKRLLARAKHACGQASKLELRLLAICDHEGIPWSAVRRKDVEAFVEGISTWDEGAYALAVESACSARAGVGFWLNQSLPEGRDRGLQAHIARLASCWMPSRGLSLQERDAVLTAAETPPDEARFGSRVATLYDARSRLTAGRIHVERIRAFSSSTERDPRMDAELMDLDDALRGLAIRITDERVRGMLSRRAFVGARYAERTVPRLYEYWLEAVAAKRHQETE